jgi:hypothetical protein
MPSLPTSLLAAVAVTAVLAGCSSGGSNDSGGSGSSGGSAAGPVATGALPEAAVADRPQDVGRLADTSLRTSARQTGKVSTRLARHHVPRP